MTNNRSFLILGVALAGTLACNSASAFTPKLTAKTALRSMAGSQLISYQLPTVDTSGRTYLVLKPADSARLAIAIPETDELPAAPLVSVPARAVNQRAISGPPRDVAVTADIEEATVTWAAPAWTRAGVDEYLVTYQPGDGSVQVDAATLTATFKGLTGDTEYTFSVRASNGYGDSEPISAKVKVLAPPPPPPPPPAPPVTAPPVVASGSHVISGVAMIYQNHNLSCEEATTSMALTHQGMYVSQDQILSVLGVDSTPVVMNGNTVVSWGNPDRAFVGNVNGLERNHTGYQANPKALMRVINYFGGRVIEWGEPGVAGYISPQEIYAQVKADHPVVAYATWDWAWHPRHDYISEDGNMVAWIGPYDAHVYTVVGVNDWSVLVNDPVRGQYWVSKGSFEAAYSDFNMAIVFA